MSVRVSLGNVIRHRSEFIEIDDFEVYKRCRVQVNTKGIILRDKVKGIEIKTKRQQVCKAGEFLVAEIDAKMGGFGIVPPELDGAIVSSHYFLYEVDESVLDAKYLGFYIRTSDFIDQVQAQGSTNYAAIRPHDVLEYTIPLPPLEEQRRIVARIEALATKIEEAQELRECGVREVEALEKTILEKAYNSCLTKSGLVSLSDACLTITDGDHLTPTFQDTGVKFIFVGNVSSGSLNFKNCKYVASEYYDSIKPHRKPERGDILYSAVGATLGIPAMVDSDEIFCFQRHIALLKPDRDQLIPEFLLHMLRCPSLYKAAWKSTTGSAQPTIPLRSIRSLQIPKLPLDEQRTIVSYLDTLKIRVLEVKLLRETALKEFNILLPAALDKAFKGEL